jgi:hypothetical protein
MTNYCPQASSDPASRTGWGVDLNRNNSVGSLFDGYFGASSSCTNEVFAGPSEASEPEIRNELWVTSTFPNIKFSNNIHSYGGYFMWAPGSYKADTSGLRETLPAPNIGIEKYFFKAADNILNRIKEYRGTAILPQRTGPISDVLYSAAGNSADEQWYNRGIIAYSFETGADRFTSTTTGTAQTEVGFQPNFTTEGQHESMEFAAGNYGLLESALEYSNDVTPPVVEAESSDDIVASQTPINVRFKMVSEPSQIWYTTDGSAPTTASAQYQAQGPRRPGQVFTYDHTTTLRWLAIDIKGNQSTGSKTFFVETDAPTTTATLNPAAPNGQDGWYLTPVTVTLTATDGVNGSGVDKTEYRVDGGVYQPYSAPFSIGSDGPHTVGFRSTDRAGNVEAEKTVTFKVDNPILGTRQLGTMTDTLSSTQPEAYRNVATATGTVDHLTVYVASGTTAPWLVAGIYTDGGNGHPKTLLSQQQILLTKGAWNTVTFPAVQIAQGTPYWIAVQGDAGILKIRTNSGGHGTQNSEWGKRRNQDWLPTTWTTDKVFLLDGPLSAYTVPTVGGGGT